MNPITRRPAVCLAAALTALVVFAIAISGGVTYSRWTEESPFSLGDLAVTVGQSGPCEEGEELDVWGDCVPQVAPETCADPLYAAAHPWECNCTLDEIWDGSACVAPPSITTDLGVTKDVYSGDSTPGNLIGLPTNPETGLILPLTVSSEVIYLLTVTNHGPAAVPNAAVSDRLPAGVEFIAAGAGAYDLPTGTWAIGHLDPLDSVSLLLRVRTTSVGVITNIATVTTDLIDTNGLNNTASAAILVQPANTDLCSIPAYREINAAECGCPAGQVIVAGPLPGQTVCAAPQPSLSLVKRAEVNGQAYVPGSWVDGTVAGLPSQAEFTYLVTNHGAVPLLITAVTDDVLGTAANPAVTCPGGLPQPLAAGASLTCTASWTIAGWEMDRAGHTNTALVTAVTDDETGRPLAGTDTLTIHLNNPSIKVTKTLRSVGASPRPYVNGARVNLYDQLNFEYLVTNEGNTTLTDLVVRDTMAVDGLARHAACDATTLTPGASTTCRMSWVVSVAEAAAGFHANTATVTAGGLAGAASAQVMVEVNKFPIVITKAPDDSTPGPYEVGQTVKFVYTITNYSESTSWTITDFEDDMYGAIAACIGPTLAMTAATDPASLAYDPALSSTHRCEQEMVIEQDMLEMLSMEEGWYSNIASATLVSEISGIELRVDGSAKWSARVNVPNIQSCQQWTTNPDFDPQLPESASNPRLVCATWGTGPTSPPPNCTDYYIVGNTIATSMATTMQHFPNSRLTTPYPGGNYAAVPGGITHSSLPHPSTF
ncbi:MAG: DUF11 domain-containing protein [Promicromonosporaceae bacterium]|nr:DUF11 domain-containing protein [Promicromonosporaceae bacterium]